MNKENENLFKGKFDYSKIKVKGPDWFHDPSGEELEIIHEDEESQEENKKDTLK